MRNAPGRSRSHGDAAEEEAARKNSTATEFAGGGGVGEHARRCFRVRTVILRKSIYNYCIQPETISI